MARGDLKHNRRGWGSRIFRWLPVVLVLATLGSAAAAYRFDLGPRWFGFEDADPVGNPAAVAPPKGLTLPPIGAAAPVAVGVDPSASGAVSPQKVRRALAAGLGDRKLGGHVMAAVANLSGESPVFESGATSATPASTMKLLTSVAALESLGPSHTFSTSVVRGASASQVVLVGGGDPYLASKRLSAADAKTVYPERADVPTLAKAVATSLKEEGRTRVSLVYDDSLFSGPTASPQWRPDYISDGIVSPITALWVDRGQAESGSGRVADPSRAAADVFARALGRQGITVVGMPKPGRAPAGTAELGAVQSASVDQIVQHLLDVSDNETAEVLAHHVGLAERNVGSFADGAAGVVQVLRRLGVPVGNDVIHDGSGLSRQNVVSSATLLDVLRVASSEAHPDLRSVVTGLPVAGFTGSLSTRFATGDEEGRGRVRAKTGTLSGVHGLAGVATDLDGNVMVFAFIADRVKEANSLAARETVDELAAALGACRCGA